MEHITTGAKEVIHPPKTEIIIDTHTLQCAINSTCTNKLVVVISDDILPLSLLTKTLLAWALNQKTPQEQPTSKTSRGSRRKSVATNTSWSKVKVDLGASTRRRNKSANRHDTQNTTDVALRVPRSGKYFSKHTPTSKTGFKAGLN